MELKKVHIFDFYTLMPMKKAIIFHNNACGTSRKVLNVLKELNFEIEIRDYIKNPPSIIELKEILSKAGLSAMDLLRKNNKIYKESFEGNAFTNDEWLIAISKNPSILERPIVIIENKAILARPADKIKELFRH